MSVLKLQGSAPLLSSRLPPISWAPSSIDLSELTWATPYDIAALAVIWTRLYEDGRPPKVVLPDDRQVRAYLVDIGLADAIPGDWGVRGASRVEPPLVRLTRFAEPEEWDELLPDIIPGAYGALKDSKLAKRTLDILSELIDNAATHGHSAAGTFVCAQRYTGATSGLEPGVWLGIADGGRGIPSHLRLNPKYREIERDEELIQLARRPWVTGTRDRRGWGLVEVFEDASAAGPSDVVIRSGRGEGSFRLRAGLSPHARYRALRPAIPGAWVHLRVEATVCVQIDSRQLGGRKMSQRLEVLEAAYCVSKAFLLARVRAFRSNRRDQQKERAACVGFGCSIQSNRGSQCLTLTLGTT
jgi:hypothetical protein